LVQLLEKNASPEVMERFTLYRDVDGALEKAENDILSAYHQTLEQGGKGARVREALFHAAADELDTHLRQQERLEEILERMETFIERKSLAAGEILVQEGSLSTKIFLVLWGSISLFVDDDQPDPHRLEVLGPGRVIAPQAVWRADPSPYTARVEHQALVAGISREKLEELEAKDRETAMFFYKFMARMLTRTR
jgi:CRP-like cAMP-binding protein